MSLPTFFGFILAQAAGHQVVFILNVTSTEVEDAQMKETDFKCAVILHSRSAMTRFISWPGVFEQNFNNAVRSQLNDDFVALGQNGAVHRTTAWHGSLLLCPEGN